MLLTDEAHTPVSIRALGIRSNDRQEEFAAQLGVSHRSVNRGENGYATPSPMALKLIQDLAAASRLFPTPIEINRF